MRTLFLPHAEVVQRLDALSLPAPMREGFIAHSRGRTAPGLVRATALPGQGIARVTGVGLVPDLPAYSVSSAATSPEGVEHATLLLHDLGTGKLLAWLEAVHLRAVALALGIAIAADVLARPEASRVAVLDQRRNAASAEDAPAGATRVKASSPKGRTLLVAPSATVEVLEVPPR